MSLTPEEKELINIFRNNKWKINFNFNNRNFLFENMKYVAYCTGGINKKNNEVTIGFSSDSVIFEPKLDCDLYKKEDMMKIKLISKEYNLDGFLEKYFLNTDKTKIYIYILLENYKIKKNIIPIKMNRFELIDI